MAADNAVFGLDGLGAESSVSENYNYEGRNSFVIYLPSFTFFFAMCLVWGSFVGCRFHGLVFKVRCGQSLVNAWRS